MLPVQRPRPPIWMAANRDAAVRRAARLSDAWLINPHATVETIERQIGLFRETRSVAGLPADVGLPLIREVFCARDRESAVAAAGPFLQAKYETYSRWGQDRAMPVKESFDAAFAELEQGRFVVGSPEDCVRQLLPWKRMGVTHFIFRTHWPGMPVEDSLQSIDLLSREVLPPLRGTALTATPSQS